MMTVVRQLVKAALHGVSRRLARWLAGRHPAHPVKANAAPRLVTVVRLDDRLGNQLSITPLARALREHFPHARHRIVTGVLGARLWRNHPNVETVALGGRGPGAWWRTWIALRALRRDPGDIWADAGRAADVSRTQTLLSLWAGAPVRVRLRPDDPAWRTALDGAYSALVAAPSQDTGESAQIGALAPVFGAGGDACPEPLVAPRYTADVTGIWRACPGPRIALFVGARQAARRAQVAWYRALVHELASQGAVVVVAGGAGDGPFVRIVTAGLAPNARSAPDLPREELAGLFLGADVVVANDTGPKHLAVALRVPTLSIHTCTCPVRFGYRLPGYAAVGSRQSPPTVPEAVAAVRALLRCPGKGRGAAGLAGATAGLPRAQPEVSS